MTRDSIVWWVGIGFAIILGLATVPEPATLGIPAVCLPYLRLAALIIGIVSGKLATSPLPGAPKNNTVSVRTLGKL
jgi:hypothetical protein